MSKKLFIVLVVSFFVRLFLAWAIELGNDEVYYRIFALFPDWSYFDHPPLVAWLIRLTTLGSEVSSDLMVRLGAVVVGTANTYLIYRIVRRVSGGSEQAGLISALLYSGSVYCFVISGTFIMPDTPLTLFWLLGMGVLLDILPCGEPSRSDDRRMLLAGLYIGLAMLSKYTGAYLWGAAGLYILLFNRAWLKRWSLYVGALISVLVFLPVIVWNVQNDFITFTFHGARVTADSSFNWLYFGRELMGGVLYNNPINWVVAVVSLFAWRGRRYVSVELYRMLLCFSLPMIALFFGVSFTRETLPHWAAPAYLALIVLSAVYLSGLGRRGVRIGVVSFGLVVVVGILGAVQINHGLFKLDDRVGVMDMGRRDFSLDTYGWRQGGDKFAELVASDTIMPEDAAVLQYGWDDAAHIDCYFSLPHGFTTKTIGNILSTHYWEWINECRGGFSVGDSVYLVTSSRYALDPQEIYKDDFREILPADTLKIYRSGEHVYNFYVYRLLDLQPDSRALKSQIR